MTTTEQLPLRIHALRQLNPVLSCVLKSPWHGLASKRLLALRHRGRKTGKSYTIPLAYVSYEGQTYCVTRNTQWWQNAVSAPSVTIWLRGRQLDVVAERVPSTDAETRAVFEKFLAENPGTAQLVYRVRVDPAGKPDVADLEREIHHSNLVRFKGLA